VQKKRGVKIVKFLDVSTMNLRRSRKHERIVDTKIVFCCSFCGKKRTLGLTTGSMSRFTLRVNEKIVQYQMCGFCADIYVDVLRFGTEVFADPSVWKKRSLVARFSHEEGKRKKCLRCLRSDVTKLFVRFDDLTRSPDYRGGRFTNLRVCGKCAFAYLLFASRICSHSNVDKYQSEDVQDGFQEEDGEEDNGIFRI
jgi:hypothetical protein